MTTSSKFLSLSPVSKPRPLPCCKTSCALEPDESRLSLMWLRLQPHTARISCKVIDTCCQVNQRPVSSDLLSNMFWKKWQRLVTWAALPLCTGTRPVCLMVVKVLKLRQAWSWSIWWTTVCVHASLLISTGWLCWAAPAGGSGAGGSQNASSGRSVVLATVERPASDSTAELGHFSTQRRWWLFASYTDVWSKPHWHTHTHTHTFSHHLSHTFFPHNFYKQLSNCSILHHLFCLCLLSLRAISSIFNLDMTFARVSLSHTIFHTHHCHTPSFAHTTSLHTTVHIQPF